MSVITEKKKTLDKAVLLGKTKLNSMEVLISEALINAHIIQDEIVLANNVLLEYDDMKEEMKNWITSTAHQRF